MLHLRPVLAQLQTEKLNASQKLELEAFQLLDRAANLENVAEALLMPAKSLQLQAQTEQHPLAQAAAFRALHWVQMRMRLHHAALDSLARAAELYERCALPELVVQMKAARCRVMLSAEMHEELRQFCATMLAQSDTLSPAIYTTLLDYSASASYYLALEEGDPVKADQHWSDCLVAPRAGAAVHAQVRAGITGMRGAAESGRGLGHARTDQRQSPLHAAGVCQIRQRRLLGTVAASVPPADPVRRRRTPASLGRSAGLRRHAGARIAAP
jgi:hypothetical protein